MAYWSLLKSRTKWCLLLSTIAVCWPAVSVAQSNPEIRVGADVPPGSEPEGFVVAGDYVYFSADDGQTGRELWRTRGERGDAEQVGDIHPGVEGSYPRDFYAVGDRLHFSANTSLLGRELWVVGGGANQPQLVTDIWVGIEGSDPVPIHHDGDTLYFRARTPEVGMELWRTDGSTAGTALVRDLFEGPRDSMPGSYGVAGLPDGTFLITGYNVLGSSILWHSDGTTEGTRYLPFGPAVCSQFITFGDGAFYAALGPHGHEPYWTDGTKDGTRMLRDISSAPSSNIRVGASLGNVLVIAAEDDENGLEPWITDGTESGTVLLRDIHHGAGSSEPYKFTRVGDEILFIANDGQSGKELWVTNGTEAGTRLVKDIYEGPDSTEPYAFCPVAGGMFFSPHEEVYGEELWFYDSNTGNAHLVADIVDGPQGSEPYGTVALGDICIFAASHPDTGREVWRSDGTPEGTYLVADICTEAPYNPSSSPTQLTTDGSNRLFFVVNDLEHGAELWISDGSEAGTVMVRDIFPGAASSDPQHLTATEDGVYFVAEDGAHGREIWFSDGTAEGTSLVLDLNPDAPGSRVREMLWIPYGLFFVATREDVGEELFVLGGDGKLRVRDTRPGPESSHPEGLVVTSLRTWIYFHADDGVHGRELWKMKSHDTFEAKMVRDIVVTPRLGSVVGEMAPLNEGVGVVVNDGVHGAELWAVGEDDKKAGLVKDIRSGNPPERESGSR